MKDSLFSDPQGHLEPFAFDSAVADVFDDMVGRSIPQYESLQALVAALALRWARGRPIFDVGCSTGNTLAAIAERASEQQSLWGVDTSADMIAKARAKLQRYCGRHDVRLLHGGAVQLDAVGAPAGVIVLSLVAQFVRPLARPSLIKDLFGRLDSGGALIFVEKTIDPCLEIRAAYIEEYHRLKQRNGYSNTEIARKREALENQLVPFQTEENVALLTSAGFSSVSIFFTWLNFQGYLALRA